MNFLGKHKEWFLRQVARYAEYENLRVMYERLIGKAGVLINLDWRFIVDTSCFGEYGGVNVGTIIMHIHNDGNEANTPYIFVDRILHIYWCIVNKSIEPLPHILHIFYCN